MNPGSIVVLIGTLLVALDLILWHATAAYRRHDMLQVGALLIGIGVLAGAGSLVG
jgi:hypothetical protein